MNLIKNLSFIKNLKIDSRKKSKSDIFKIKGNNINIDTSININVPKENNIELSEQALRIYKVFKESNDSFLGITRNEKGIPEISLQPSGEVIENLDLRFVEGNIQELVKSEYLVKVKENVYKLGK